MGWKFNSGIGGYTCDECCKLIFAGMPGKQKKYIYDTEHGEEIESASGELRWIFCSMDCYLKWRDKNDDIGERIIRRDD